MAIPLSVAMRPALHELLLALAAVGERPQHVSRVILQGECSVPFRRFHELPAVRSRRLRPGVRERLVLLSRADRHAPRWWLHWDPHARRWSRSQAPSPLAYARGGLVDRLARMDAALGGGR